jgi:hypothetical protein
MSYENHKMEEDKELNKKKAKFDKKGKRTNFKKDLHKMDLDDLMNDEFAIYEELDERYFQ